MWYDLCLWTKRPPIALYFDMRCQSVGGQGWERKKGWLTFTYEGLALGGRDDSFLVERGIYGEFLMVFRQIFYKNDI